MVADRILLSRSMQETAAEDRSAPAIRPQNRNTNVFLGQTICAMRLMDV